VAAVGLNQKIRVCRLLGGSEDNDLTLSPDEPAVLVGTQDILLSRALNRGYARRPFRWPIDFALLNNDCAWVLDEVQLLGDGLSTSTQLAAFREKLTCFGAVPSCWISATFDPTWLRTVDFAGFADSLQVIELNSDDFADPTVQRRVRAAKTLTCAPEQCRLPAGVAEFCAINHRAGTLSLVVANTVTRAREICLALEKGTPAEIVLLHSRFRAGDRVAHTNQMSAPLPPEGRIVISTQVIEAGIDISADLLITDLAPYSSLVQRFGRVNRYGDQPDSRIFWVDRPLTAKRRAWCEQAELKPKEQEQVSLPYTPTEVRDAHEMLKPVHSAAPADLPPVVAPASWEHVLRRADLLDLFDTTPDLGGNEIDISRFVRSGEDRDVYLAWRDWDDGANDDPPRDIADLEEAELCPVPIGEVREFAKKHMVWCWNPLLARWARPDGIYPGLSLLVHTSAGGYTAGQGWAPESRAPVTAVQRASGEQPEKLNEDRFSYLTYRQQLGDHTNSVCAALGELLESLANLALEPYGNALEAAARQHDWGKAHPVMQQTLHNGTGPYAEILAKQQRALAARGHSVPFFRHELASALAMVAKGEDDLAAYVVVAHHGRVRVSIRSMPGERDAGGEVARGIREGDQLLPVDLGDGVMRPAVTLTLQQMSLGSNGSVRSWTDRVLRLRDSLGPFRLAYFEMLLRAADERASQRDGEQRKP
jgi:CRISPR-associated endonuclease/helicase Cas3